MNLDKTNISRYKAQFILFIIDILLLLLSIYISSLFFLPPELNVFDYHTGPTVFTLCFTTLTLYIFDAYNISSFGAKGELICKLILCLLIANITTGFTSYILGHWQFPQSIFILQTFFSLFLLFISRLIFIPIVKKYPKDNVIILGNTEEAKILKEILSQDISPYHLIGIIDLKKDNLSPNNDTFNIHNLNLLTEKYQIKHIILTTFSFNDKISSLLIKLRINGVKIESFHYIYERLSRRVPILFLQKNWLLFEDGFDIYSRRIIKHYKRVCDLFCSILLILSFSPLFLIIPVLIKLFSSPGPVIYSQKRVGKNEQEFKLYKFRTMRMDAEKDGARWAEKNDPRITPIGKILRRFRLDELPQLWNVLKGEMSLIGPRPERKCFVEQLKKDIPFYYLRHTVKPGLTGWAQINFSYANSLDDAITKLEYDLYYLKNTSPLLDIKVILKTIGIIIFGKGAF